MQRLAAAHETPERWVTWGAWEDAPLSKEELVGCGVGRFGLWFVWGPSHLTRAELEPLRQVGDPAMDAAYAEARSVDALLRSEASSCRAIVHAETPSWVDWTLVSRGQRVCATYLPHVGLSLYYISLIGGFAAAAIAKTLATSKLAGSHRAAVRRLLGTGAFVYRVCSMDLRPGGEAWRDAIRVRHVHAAVRARDPTAANLEDSIVTLLAFSYNVIVGIEILAGHPISLEEKEAYLHLWRYVGSLLGIPDDRNPCSSLSRAKATLESIFMHILEPDDYSRALAQNILRLPPQSLLPYAYRAALFRVLLGNQLADALHLPPTTTVVRARVALVQLTFFVYSRLLTFPVIRHVFIASHALAMRIVLAAYRSFYEKKKTPRRPLRT
ncbi:hypothetical protein CTAYLR_008473 [Chrysophaeum taylorii]|uniref:ER-bound oxygenase mpaB/mpaB'/Rubber oxygenase catalytic domain-containing protein n=1 Tax=Chrysophaeum taylorii TaxID=2483200 RepID=A0AAD7XM92_9STRA|nr:hypothetical protein CTAYLR_008473 [Chrysophaeum taylorii]